MEKTKTTIATIALILLLTISAILVVLPIATAQDATRTTYPFIGVIPNPVGVNQVVLMHVGIFQQLSNVAMGWEGLSITIERPDGVTDTISDITTDSTGGTGVVYTPTQAGTYILRTHFPQQEITATKTAPGIPIGTVMLASSSQVLELEVQTDPIPYYPAHSLPTEYWTRPIDPQLREWYTISGSWLDSGNQDGNIVSGNEYAPDSAHILWTKPLTLGGLAGGMVSGEWAFSHGDAYEGKWESRIIINGILIYTHRTNTRPLEYTAVKLHTGEELWTKTFLDNRTIAFGQELVWAGYNHHAVYPYIWVTIGSDWYAFDPYTGEWEFTVENVPSGTTLVDDQGWLYRCSMSESTGEGYLWSMTDLIVPLGIDSPAGGSWSPAGSFYGQRYATYDAADTDEEGNLTTAAQRAYISEFTCPTDLPGSIGGWGGVDRAWAFGDKVFGLRYSTTEINTWGISLDLDNIGTLLFNETWAAPASWEAGQVQIEFNAISLEEGAAVFWVKDTLEYYAFSTDTGKYMWGPAEPEFYMNYYGWTELLERPILIWDGKLYSSGCGGIIYCYDLTDGDVLWTYVSEDPYQEYLFANNWWQFFLFITDGKLYTSHMEHSAIEPMPRGAPFLCLDATTGDLIWEADGLFRSTRWGGRAIIGDSIIVTMDTYDNRIYAIGKGPSQTTVSIQNDVITQGNSVMIKGMVTDVSPGTEDAALRLRFPNGVPAVADESMSEWMLYVYKQFERPADATGVEVTLMIRDPNGDYYETTVTSDGTGAFSHMWAPAFVGEYYVTALFEGSKSYYTSYATTAFGVDQAPATEYPDVDVPTAEEIAQATVNRLPAYPEVPDVPSAEEVAQETINRLPAYPEMPEIPDIPAYLTIDLAIIAAVVIAIIIGLYGIVKKQK